MLGYFSLVGLSRVHGLIGDYYTSLQALYPINPFQQKHLCTTKVAGISTFIWVLPRKLQVLLFSSIQHMDDVMPGRCQLSPGAMMVQVVT